MVMAQATQPAIWTSCPRRAATFRPASGAETPLFQAFLRFSHHGSTDCHCIKDGTPIDPACGSGGFLIGALDYVYQKIEKERDNEDDIIENKKDYASECVFGMDYDKTIAKVAKAYMLIWGDGRSNIAACDSLNSSNWDNDVLAKFTVGHGNGCKLRQFDIIITNPPFAGDIAADDTLSQYELAFKVNKKGNRKRINKVSRDKLFIERCINMLVPGGRMAIANFLFLRSDRLTFRVAFNQ